MNVVFSKAKQSESKRDPVMCSLYEARAKCVPEYKFEQQQYLKEGLLEVHSACAFAKIHTTDPPTQYLATPFGNVPTSCALSYQALQYDKQQVNRESPSHPFPALPLSIIEIHHVYLT